MDNKTAIFQGAKSLYNWLLRTATHISKGALLMAWVAVMASVSVYSANNKLSDLIVESIDNDRYVGSVSFPGDYNEPRLYLNHYMDMYWGEGPPIESMLDKLIPGWENSLINNTNKNSENELNTWRSGEYSDLFKKVSDLLYSFVDNEDDLSRVRINIPDVVPHAFLQVTQSTQYQIKKDPAIRTLQSDNISIPPKVISWVKSKRESSRIIRKRVTLVDTLAFLMVLGAFGSLIFLTRDYILLKSDVGISSYIFRPVLGVFLAIAVYIVDIATHAIISSSDIFQVRSETLFVLAFAAGLLSEKTYYVVVDRLEPTLDRFGNESGSKGGNGVS